MATGRTPALADVDCLNAKIPERELVRAPVRTNSWACGASASCAN